MPGPIFPPIDPQTFLPPTKTVDALAAVIADRISTDPGAGASLQDITEAVAAHVNNETPHPVYDDAPSLTLFYQARKAAQQ